MFTSKCQLVGIVKLRYIIMRYIYQTRHLANYRERFCNSYFHDEVIYMNGCVWQGPTHPLHPILPLPPPNPFLNIRKEGTDM